MLFASLLPLIAQASLPQAGTPTLEEDRLEVCLMVAQEDTVTAISNASQWDGEATGAERSYPLQCLGVAYSWRLDWAAAEQAFAEARELTPESDLARRARLGAMAGNAALPAEQYAAAASHFSLAVEDALAAGDALQAGAILTDQSRALVALDDIEGAAQVLRDARRLDPQNPDTWLLSATLERRRGNLEDAAAQIATAAALAPADGEVGLEAGVIAMLSGNEDGARKSWQSVLDIAPGTPAAKAAQGYLAQTEPEDAGG